MMDLLFLLIGGVGLYFGAEWLVDGAANLARRLGVAPIVIGLTIVSYGTSAPELAVSLLASMDGSSEIAIGNVVGSNIANIGLILGLTALIAPPRVDGSLRKRDLPLLALASFALPVILRDGLIDRTEATVFVVGAIGYTYAAFKWAPTASESQSASASEEDEHDEPPPTWKLSGLIVVGLVVLIGGGKAFVEGAIGMARAMGMSERVVGLTVVAVGTSLPELAASLMAAMKGHSELAVGNVVGSNLFNILLVLGVASLVHPIECRPSEFSFDLGVMCLLTVMCIFSMRKARVMGRVEGATLVAMYVGFLGALATMR